MKAILVIYLIIATTTYISLLIANYLYLAIRPSINNRDRIKIDTNIKSIVDVRKFSIFWPFIIYRLIK